MPAEERRELILQAATRAFARAGYAGTSTDHVAKEAGVSQPYVVRMFGTKLDLFLEVFDRACRRIDSAFAALVAEPGFDAAGDGEAQLGEAYKELLADSDFLRVMMHGFATGSGVPEIAATARAGMGRLFGTLRDAGWEEERVRDFIAFGMLLNVLLSIGALGDNAGPLGELVSACLPEHWNGLAEVGAGREAGSGADGGAGSDSSAGGRTGGGAGNARSATGGEGGSGADGGEGGSGPGPGRGPRREREGTA